MPNDNTKPIPNTTPIFEAYDKGAYEFLCFLMPKLDAESSLFLTKAFGEFDNRSKAVRVAA